MLINSIYLKLLKNSDYLPHCASILTYTISNTISIKSWWSQAASNRRPPACKAGALPTELWPPIPVVGLGGLEPPTSPLSGVRSNQLSYRPSS